MSKSLRFTGLGMLLLSLMVGWLLVQQPPSSPVQAAEGNVSPFFFVPNEGQYEPEVLFQAYGMGGTLSFHTDGYVLSIPNFPEKYNDPETRWAWAHGMAPQGVEAIPPTALRLHFEGAYPKTTLEGIKTLPGVIHYFLGNDPKGWLTNLPTYEELVYKNLYPGIDVHYEGTEGALKSTFIVAPGGNPALIRWRYEGAVQVSKEAATGDLKITLASRAAQEPTVLLERAPVVWQEIKGKQVFVETSTELLEGGLAGFSLGAYDPSYPLVIDPSLVYGSYFGFGGSNVAGLNGYAVATDGGDAYVTGYIFHDQGSTGEGGAYVMKISPSGVPAYISVFGGSGDEYGLDIAVVPDGDILYLTGWTDSEDFPIQLAYQDTLAGGRDAFMMRVGKDNGLLISSTFLGGAGNDFGYGIAVNSVGRPTITGSTASLEFPTYLPYQATYGGLGDAFVTKFNSLGTALIYSTYLGESDRIEDGNGIALNEFGAPYITGRVYMSGSGNDAFVAKLNVMGDDVDFFTILGGTEDDYAVSVAVDGSGKAHITGQTSSANFPMVSPLLGSCGGGGMGCYDVFVAIVTSGGSLLFSDFLGGSLDEYAGGIAVDGGGHFYVTGTTLSADFFTLDPIRGQLEDGEVDAFLTKYAPGGVAFNYSTYVGNLDPSQHEYAYDVAVSPDNYAYLSGQSSSGVYVAAVSDADSNTPFPTATEDALATATLLSPTPSSWVPTWTPVPPTNTPTPTATPTSTPASVLSVEILDTNGAPVSALTTNEEGWYAPNPLTVQITVANTEPEELNGTIDFIFGSPTSSTRFYVINAPETCSFSGDGPYSNQTYLGACNVLILTGEPPQTLSWEVWIQPSTDGAFDVNAELLVNSNLVAMDVEEVDVLQAAINPVVFIHGILGSMPPGQYLWTSRPTELDIQIPSEPVLDPFLESYYPMVDHLEKMGYEWGTTLFALAYDWRDSNDASGSFLGDSIVDVALPSASQLPYVASNPQVDLVVHSNGGLVSRACIQDGDSGCHGNVHKIIFIASPHQGFASDYRTREGLTWGDYFGHEVPGGADLWITMQPFMDFLLWPRMIRLQYNPTSQEIEEDCSPSFPLGTYDCSIAHYEWAHDPARGIVSLSQMLPTTDLLDENYITNIFDQQEPWPCTAGVKPNDLENDWLEDLNSNISQLVTEVGEENIYVLYSEEFGNLTDRQYPAICVSHPYGQWPYGWPITEVEIPAEFGDDLIPVESTTLRRSGLLLIPLANETIIDEFGHKGIAYAPAAQQKVTEYLTGGQISSGTTPYHYPNALENLARIIAVFVTTDGGENLGESSRPNLPVQIMITDPAGQQFGYDPVSEAMIPGIPGAFYSGYVAPQFMVLFNTLPGDYQITVTGVGDTNFEMQTYSIDERGLQLMNVFTGTVTTGQVITHTAAYTVSADTLFFDDMESGGSDWTGEGGWSLDADTAYSPITSWASGMITPSMPQTLTLEVPLDLSAASLASLTFWHTYTLSSQAQAFVEASTDGGITWQAVITYQNETHDWTPLVISLTPFTGPEYDPLQLRFRLVSTHPGDQWRIDDVRVETIAPPTLFDLPFEDNVESWRKWEGEGGWVRTHTLYTSPDTAWQSSTPGAALSLAGNLDLQTAVAPALTFWYSMTLGGAGVVEILPAGESTWLTVETLTETTGWTQAEIDLSPWTGITATLRLRQTGQPGAVWTVDDFLVQEVTPPIIHPLPFTDDMESPTANWQAINAWQPVTTTAHSGAVSWLGEGSGSALMLVDQLDLSNTTSPVLSFWQQFDFPTGAIGQVRVRSETDLIWHPVLTVTTPVSGWTPINVDLSAYAGEKVELAFVVEDTPVGEGGQTSQTAPGLRPVAFGLSFLAIAVLGIAQIISEPENRSRLRKMLNIGVWIGIIWACLYFSGVLWSIPFYRAWRINHLNVVEGGKVELLVSASQKPAGAELSPGGNWMLVNRWESANSISDTRLLIDLIKNGTYTILLENTTHLRWLDDDLFMGEHSQRGFFIVTIPEEEKTYLREQEVSANSDELLALQYSQKLYAIEESGGYNFINLDGDMPSIYMISTLLSFDEHKELLMAFPNAKIISRDNRTLVEEKVGTTGSIRHLRVYSPDGSLYAENSPGSSPFLQIFSTQGDVLLARVQKRGYAPTLLGWSSDGRGFYFQVLTGGLGEVLAPEWPVFLLTLDDAGSSFTGLKVGGRVQPEFNSISAVSYSQLNLNPGWYIDDVSVFDTPPTLTPTSTDTPTSTFTPTSTATNSPTPTDTPTPTATATNTPTPTPTPSDLIFADSFESGNFSAWASYTPSNEMSVTSNAALGNMACSMLSITTGCSMCKIIPPTMKPAITPALSSIPTPFK